MRTHAISWDCMRSHTIACDCMRSRKKTLCRQLSEFLKMHREREAGQKVCLKCFVTTTVNRFHYYFFRLSQKGRNEKRESFYTAKRVSSVHSRRDETRLAVFSVPFPQNKFRTCFFLNIYDFLVSQKINVQNIFSFPLAVLIHKCTRFLILRCKSTSNVTQKLKLICVHSYFPLNI